MWVEVANTLALSYVGTEFALRGGDVARVIPRVVLGVTLLNGLSLAGSHLHIVVAVEAWLATHTGVEVAALLAASCLLVFTTSTWRGGGLHWRGVMGKARSPWGSLGSRARSLLACVVLAGLLSAALCRGGVFDGLVVPLAGRRILLALVAYPMACFTDLWRSCPGLTLHIFLAATPRAVLLTACLFAPAVMVIAAAFLAFLSMLERLGIDPHILNMPVYYGVIYGPFVTYYFAMKRQLLSKASLLPF